MKNIFILGTGRAGKSTLAQMLKQKYPDANLLHADAIKNGIIRNPYNVYGLKEEDDLCLFIQHAVAKAFACHIQYSSVDDINIFEGAEISPSILHEYFPDESTIIFLGHGNRTAKDIFELCNTYDIEKDWTFNLRYTPELYDKCKKWEDWNNYLAQEAVKYGYIYVDTYEDRQNLLQKLCQNL